jgi:hypothetical protein
MSNRIITAVEGLNKFIQICKNNNVKNIIDIGAGEYKDHARILTENGFNVATVDFFDNSDFVGDYMKIDLPMKYDAIWSAHVLEHQLNVNLFLEKIRNDVKEGGIVGITVPPMKPNIVGGHLTVWNAGLLLYNMTLANFDCSNAKMKRYGYNITVIVKRKDIKELPKLKFDRGDIEVLSKFFPNKMGMKQNFDGNITQFNW